MNNNIKTIIIDDGNYMKYKHFIRGLIENDEKYDGIIVVKSFKQNKITKNYKEYVLSLTY